MKQTLLVLIVEDSELDTELLLHELNKQYSVEAHRVDTKGTFLEALDSHVYDLILCDHTMPGFSGFEALALYKERHLDIPFIFVSGTIGEDTAEEAMKAGAWDYLMKGNLKRLVPAVERELMESERRKNAENSVGESERMFSTLAEESPNMIFINHGGKIAYANKKCEEIMGYRREEFYSPGFDFLTLIAPEQVETVKESFSRHLLNLELAPYECSIVTKGGRKLEAIVTTKLITVRGERAILGIVTDVTERKQAELQIKHALDWQEAVFEGSRDAVFISDVDSRFVAVNRAACELTGYSKRELLSMRIPDLHDHLDLDAYNKYHSQILGGARILTEAKILRKDGTKVDTEFNNTSLFIAGVRYIHTIARDITERTLAEMKLRESEFLVLESQRVGRIGSYAMDFVGGRWRSSEVLDEIFGIDKDYGRTIDGWLNLVHPDYRQEMSEYLRDITAGKKHFYREYPIIRRNDGEERWVLGRGELGFDEYGTLVKMIGTIQDITDRRKVEEALHLQVSALKSAANSVVITDTKGIIQWVNPAFTKLTGYTADEVVGRNPRILKSDRQDNTLYEHLWKTILSGKVWHGEIVNKRKDGTLYNEEMTITPVVGGDGRIRNFVAVMQDVTEQNKAEQHRKTLELQLAQAQKMEAIGTLAGGIAHDFNNILGIILGHLTILQRPDYDSTLRAHSFETITKTVQRGANLVRQILTFARKTRVSPGQVNLSSVAHELVRLLRETFPKTIEIVVEAESMLPVIEVDQTQFYQALMNLCINARDAMMDPEGSSLGNGKLTIRLSRISGLKTRLRFPDADGSDYVSVAVSDTGSGFDEQTKQKIFEPFFTTKDTGKGTGLGLAVVYGVIKSHNGFIDVESQVGKGSTFTLYFPATISREVLDETRTIDKHSSSIGNETILVVEDEEGLRSLMQLALERNGYKVVMARDGVEALEMFESNRESIALVLTDMGLPKLDGSEMFAMLKMRDPDVKVILASGYLEAQYKSELLKAGVKEFVQKPYVPEQVLRKIRFVLDSK